MAEHPKTNLVEFIFPDGTSLKSMTTYSKGDVFHCEKSISNHPAWNPDVVVKASNTSESVQSFNNKYKGLFGE